MHRLAGDPVERLRAVAGGEHLGVRAAALRAVDLDRAGLAQPQAGVAGQRHLRAHAQPEDDEVGRGSCPRRCAPRATTPSASTSISRTGCSVCTSMPMSPMRRAHPLGHVDVQLRHRQRVGQDDGDVEAARVQHLGHLQADVARRRGRRPASRPAATAARMSAPSASRCTPCTPSASSPGTGGPQRPAAGGDERASRSRARLAVPVVTVPASRSIASARVPMRTSMSWAANCAGVRAISLSRSLDQAADPVGDAAGGVGDVGPLLEDDDLQVAGARAAAGPARPRTCPRRPRR